MTTIDTTPYVIAHGKQPKGYGCWLFCPKANWNQPDYLAHVMQSTGRYAEARKMALTYFRGKGVSDVVVCS